MRLSIVVAITDIKGKWNDKEIIADLDNKIDFRTWIDKNDYERTYMTIVEEIEVIEDE